MNVMLGSFAKKRNSTALPSGSQTSISGTLRAGCSIQNPIIGFADNRMSTPAAYNYAYITQFGRYYFIQDWKWEGGLWWAFMEVDVMGSFKTGIGQSSCYVLRAASDSDNTIVDALYPTKNVVNTVQTDLNVSPWETDFDNGFYVIGVLGQGSSNGAVNYYALSPASMKSFRTALMSDITTLVGVTEITKELTQALFNPFQYLVSAIYFPFSMQYITTGSSSNIMLGWWDTGVSAPTVSELVCKEEGTTYTFYANPSGIGETKAWMLQEPYSEYTLFWPPYGDIKLDSRVVAKNIDYEVVGGAVTFEINEYIDLISGMGYFQVLIGGVTVSYKQAMVGINTILSQSTQDVLGSGINMISGLTSIGVGAVSANPIGIINGAITGLGKMYDGVKAFVPDISVSGTNGGLGSIQVTPHIIVSRSQLPDMSVEENGEPLCKTKTISSLSGYIKTMNADVVISGATDAEQEQIRAMMNGGFFYE